MPAALRVADLVDLMVADLMGAALAVSADLMAVLVPVALQGADPVDPADLLVVVLMVVAPMPSTAGQMVLLRAAPVAKPPDGPKVLEVQDVAPAMAALADPTEVADLLVPMVLAVALPVAANVLVSRVAEEELNSGSMRLTASSTKFSARFPH